MVGTTSLVDLGRILLGTSSYWQLGKREREDSEMSQMKENMTGFIVCYDVLYAKTCMQHHISYIGNFT